MRTIVETFQLKIANEAIQLIQNNAIALNDNHEEKRNTIRSIFECDIDESVEQWLTETDGEGSSNLIDRDYKLEAQCLEYLYNLDNLNPETKGYIGIKCSQYVHRKYCTGAYADTSLEKRAFLLKNIDHGYTKL